MRMMESRVWRVGHASADVAPFLVLVAGICVALLAANLPIVGVASAVAVAVGVLGVALRHRVSEKGDLSVFLLAPTLMSAAQNVYLLAVANSVSPSGLQLLLIVNFLYAAVALAVLAPHGSLVALSGRTRHLAKRTWQALVLLILYGLATVGMFHTSPTAAVADLRNIVSPLVFLLLGLLASRWTSLDRYLRYLASLGLLAIGFGLLEYLTPGFWLNTPLADLWRAKGLPVSAGTRLPPNFYSSEMIGGHQLRRMVGPFADPVNFGTFVFVVFAAAFYLRRRVTLVVSAIAIVLAISKGALLGVFFMLIYWTRARRSKFENWLVVALVVGAALVFLRFTENSSTGSTAAHIGGFLSAIKEFPKHPLGQGLGGTGVLASLLSADAVDTSITETGLGMVIGELGIVGVIAYGIFFVTLRRACLEIGDPKRRALAMTLFYAFLANATFNAVALSPNSCAPFFIIMGILAGQGGPATGAPERGLRCSESAAKSEHGPLRATQSRVYRRG